MLWSNVSIDNTCLTALLEIDILAVVEAFAGRQGSNIWIFELVLKICALLGCFAYRSKSLLHLADIISR